MQETCEVHKTFISFMSNQWKNCGLVSWMAKMFLNIPIHRLMKVFYLNAIIINAAKMLRNQVLLHIYAHTLAKALYSRIVRRLTYICNAAIQTSELCIIPCVYDLSSKRGGSYAEAAVPHNSFKPLVCRLDRQVSILCKYIRNRSLGKHLSFRSSVYDI